MSRNPKPNRKKKKGALPKPATTSHAEFSGQNHKWAGLTGAFIGVDLAAGPDRTVMSKPRGMGKTTDMVRQAVSPGFYRDDPLDVTGSLQWAIMQQLLQITGVSQAMTQPPNPACFTDALRSICRERCADVGDPPCWKLPELVSPCEQITPCAECDADLKAGRIP